MSSSVSCSNDVIANDLPISKIVAGGILATVVMTGFFGLFGNNWVESIGSLLISNEQNVFLIYAIGILVNLGMGILYAFVYVRCLLPIRDLNYIFKGLVYGTVLTVVAYAGFPYVAMATQWTRVLAGHAENVAAKPSASVIRTKAAASKDKVNTTQQAASLTPVLDKNLTTPETLNSVAQESDVSSIKTKEELPSLATPLTQSIEVSVPNEVAPTENTNVDEPRPLMAPKAPTDAPVSAIEASKQQINSVQSTDASTTNANSQTDSNSERKSSGTNKQSESSSEAQPESQQSNSNIIKAALFLTPHDMPIISKVDVSQDILAGWFSHLIYGLVLAIFFHHRKKNRSLIIRTKTNESAS